MLKTEIIVQSNTESAKIEQKLKETGYTKTADCMWVKIYKKGNNEIIITRE